MGMRWGRFRAALEFRAIFRWWQAIRTPASLGRRGERAAARFLRWRGYRIIRQQARDRIGELDLICVRGTMVVFVEVKTRRSESAGAPSEAVDSRKQQQLVRAALSFLRRHDLLDTPCRFDVVSVIWKASERRPEIKHIEGAFEPSQRWQMHA